MINFAPQQTRLSLNHQDMEQSIGERLRVVACALPNHIAIKTLDQEITYQAFDAATERIAHALGACHLPSSTPVAILMDQGIISLTVIFGVLKAGLSYTLISPYFSLDHQRAIWQDIQKPWMLTDARWLHLAQEITNRQDRIVNLDDLDTTSRVHDAQPFHGLTPPSPDALATVLYTSGSTGEPKGVMWSHRFVLHISWQNYDLYHISPQDDWVVNSSYFYAGGMGRCYCALLCGATLHLQMTAQTGEVRLSWKETLQWLERESITILAPPLGLLREWLNSLTAPLTLPHLRLVMAGTQTLYRRDVDLFQRFFPSHTEFTQRYASSESMLLTEYRITAQTQITGENVPIGTPVPDKEVMLLDEVNQPVAPGEIGQFVVRSRYLSDGYWGQPARSAAKFLPDPAGSEQRIYLTGDLGRLLPNGLYEHLGRADNMVKIRGYQVQLEVVDELLRTLPGVHNAACAVQSTSTGERRLVAYIVPSAQPVITFSKVRHSLAATLPDYMVPSAMTTLDALPQTASGKVDRLSLPKLSARRPQLETEYLPPQNALEQSLCELWANVLELDRVGVEDNFFELGGDSILAMRLAVRVEEHWQRSVPLTFFRKPTIAHLVTLWGQESPALPPSPMVVRSDDSSPLPRPDAPPSRVRAAAAKLQRAIQQPSLVLNFARKQAESSLLHMSYPMALRWLAWWCDREQVRDTFYKVEYARFRAFAQELGIALSRAERAFVPSMMGNILEGYRLWDQRLPQHLTSNPAQTRFNALRNSRYRLWRTLAQTIAGTTHGMQEQGIEDGGNSLIAYSGFEHLQQARQAQRGVVLAGYHAALIRIPSVVLSYRLQTRDILTVSQTNAVRAEQLERASHAPVFPVAFSPVSAHTRIAVEAQQQLRQGGMVQILNDVGFETSGTFAFAIGGRDYQLKRGFAELALNTHATIVPYYARIAANGVMTTHFFPPHTPDSRQEARHDQVVDLLQHYATFLETSWRQSPESVRWRVINDHLNRRLASK